MSCGAVRGHRLLLRVLAGRLAALVGILAMLLGRSRVLLRIFVLALVVVMSRFTVVMRGRFMF